MQLLQVKVPGLPLGFAQQVMDLQMKLQQQQSLQLIQILTQMYKIAVDYYIDNDVKKAAYFQRKLNGLALKSLNAASVQLQLSSNNNKNNNNNNNNLSTNLTNKIKKSKLPQTITKQIDKYKLCQNQYLKSIVQNNQKQEIKIRRRVEEGIQKQEDNLEGRRMLRRIKSQEKLFKNV